MIGRSASIAVMFLICSHTCDTNACLMSREEVKHGK